MASLSTEIDVLISNLSLNTTDQTLRKAFEEFGVIADVLCLSDHLPADWVRVPPGYTHVTPYLRRSFIVASTMEDRRLIFSQRLDLILLLAHLYFT
ncbi:hypothetical protein AZE42_13704 [Rhizopogon vesiculosus]|uniref:RRM domain-containing protein n=1 Tax=Rhizopogon vesiculosus TaxID=180088 RepID=A0A1J8QPQ1_9AGAM|nr:hypothetical protein AZE42_13704 [Rhizopogon vesiculosus]